MIRRLFKRVLQGIKQEFKWLQFRLWLKNRAIPRGFAHDMRRAR